MPIIFLRISPNSFPSISGMTTSTTYQSNLSYQALPSFITQIKCMATTATANTDENICIKLARCSLFVTLPRVKRSIDAKNIAISISHGILSIYVKISNISRYSICSSRNKSTDVTMRSIAPITENSAAK